ncbi:hypothetical protein LTS08_001479 [Lithohypha guttulata]|uniref:uncharacterized protein n=1 Tax=Lithohypha guttulata TaxID=1690604 RepID=UPI002DE15792|nr:hypothetical protein LTR51_003857 [Lithohypha guttulata]KAK5105204.1 hypothetical protein LTS08_001479 [Lithohypha guttulata]
MLAPLTALGLAGTTFEIIHLDIRLTSTVRDAHAAGFEQYVNDLKLLVSDIRTSVSRLASIIADDTADGQTTSEKQVKFAYWINGKAGSGKSTLLYFLIRHERLADYLRTWSGTGRLTLAHFFSWSLGSALQNTEMGLLQSLLYQVLAEDESLVHQVFPELWHDIDPLQPPKLESLSLIEVKRALKRLLDVSAGRRCFCFFVDGIDEFNGDYNSIIDLLLAFEAPDLKFVLASRPVDVCLDRFAHLPQLRLQDLTAGDIEIYIDERLSSKYEMSDLMRDEPEAAVELVHELKDRASGVFLWIKLVVTSLLDGLKKGDDVADLKIRPRALPPDLKDLFASMLGKMEAGYQKQAAVLFRLVRTASLLLDGRGMPTQFLAVASRDFQSVLNRRPIAFETDKIVAWCKYVERRLRSRCCGLVEIHESSYRPDWWRTDLEKLDKSNQNLLASHVQFLHRTVAEYLYQDEVWDEVVCKSSKNTDFEPHKNLAYAALHMMKISPLADDLPTMQAYSWAKVLVRAVSDYECNRGKALEDLVDEMDLVLRHHTSTSSQFSHWSSYIDLDSARNIVHGHLVVLRQPLSSFLSFAAFVALDIYVDSKLERHGLQFGAGTSVQKIMLQSLFSRSSDWVKITWTDRVDVVCSMLKHGANPNETFEGPSLWQCCLQQLLALNCSETSSASQVTHRKRDRRRISSTPGLPRSADSPCTCSPADFRDWSQLIMACLHAGGRLADIDYLKPCAQADPGSSVCYFRQLCQHLYGVNNESHRPQPLLGLPTPLSRSVSTMHERDQGSTYGQISLSGSATALLGNAYTWGDKITHVHHNYFGGVLTSNEVSHQVQHSAENAGETRTKQDLTSRPENDFTTILAQFQSDVVAVLQASPLGSPGSENPAFREANLTENDRLMVSASHWRGCQPTTFSDRQCINPSCITSTTIGWDYVPLLKGLLCLDCYECWRATGQLRAETRGRELVLSAEDLFEQSFTNTLQLTTTCDSDDSEEELFDAPTPSTRYVVPSSVDSDTSEVFATPQSININFTRSAPSSQPGFHDITSGTPHYLRSYNGR